MSMIVESLRHYLNEHHVRFHVHPHEPRFTAQEIADVTHMPGRNFAKTVLLRAGHRYALAVLPAHEEVDLRRLSRQLHAHVELAAEDAFRVLFPECELGAAPPIAALAAEELPIYVDACLARCESIAFNGGTHTDVVEMPWAEFERLTSPRLLTYGRRRPT